MRKYLEFKYTFPELKEKIDLIEFFLHHFPDYQYEKGKKAYTLRNQSKDLIDLFIFFNDNGTQKYWNPLDGHGGDLLNFIKNNDLVKSDGTDKGYYYNLNVLLHDYLGDLDGIREQDTKTVEKVYHDKNTFFDYFEITENISELHEKQNIEFVNDYLEFRQIELKTVNNRIFKDKLFVLRQENPSNGKVYTYISSKIQSIYNGVPVGLTRKNKEFNGIERNSARGKGFFISNYYSDQAIKGIYIFEAWEDAFSFFELKNIDANENNVFIATNGAYSEDQKKDLVHFIEKHDIKNVNLCNDNDIAGSLYNLGLISLLSKNVEIKFSRIKPAVTDPIDSTILIKAEVYIRELKEIDKTAFLKLTGDISTNYNKASIKEYKEYISSENVSSNMIENELIMVAQNQDKRTFSFYIPYKNEPLSKFNKYIVKTDNNKAMNLKINQPILKDFNEDLKEFKEQNPKKEQVKTKKPKL